MCIRDRLPPVPDELQPLASLIVPELAPAKRRRATTRRTKKVADATPVEEVVTEANNLSDASADQPTAEPEQEVTEGE